MGTMKSKMGTNIEHKKSKVGRKNVKAYIDDYRDDKKDHT